MIVFIRNLVGVKTDKAVQGALEALVKWDPQAATEAELRSMEQHLDSLGREVAAARTTYDRERKEADAIVALSNQRLAAAEQLQQQFDAETDPGRKQQLQRSMETLVSMLEQMTPDVEREKQEAEEAREFLEMLEQTYADAGNKLKRARSELERAQRDMSRAEKQRDMAERQAEAARRAAGLASATDSLSVALKAMQDRASKERQHADAAQSKARLLRPTRPEEEDPNIAAALAAASGQPSRPTDLRARLEAIRSTRHA